MYRKWRSSTSCLNETYHRCSSFNLCDLCSCKWTAKDLTRIKERNPAVVQAVQGNLNAKSGLSRSWKMFQLIFDNKEMNDCQKLFPSFIVVTSGIACRRQSQGFWGWIKKACSEGSLSGSCECDSSRERSWVQFFVVKKIPIFILGKKTFQNCQRERLKIKRYFVKYSGYHIPW